MDEWQPEQEGLRQIIEILRESQSPNTLVQRKVQEVRWISKYRYSDVDNVVHYLLEVGSYEQSHTRQRVVTTLSLSLPQKVEELSRYPDFTRYLLFVLTKFSQAGEF